MSKYKRKARGDGQRKPWNGQMREAPGGFSYRFLSIAYCFYSY